MNPFRVDPRGDEAAESTSRLFDDVWPLVHRRLLRTVAGRLAWWTIPVGAWLMPSQDTPDTQQARSVLETAIVGPLLVTALVVGMLHLRGVRMRKSRRAKLVHDARTQQEPQFESIRELLATAEGRRGGGIYGLVLHASFVMCIPMVLPGLGHLNLTALVVVLVIAGLCFFHLLCSEVVVPGAPRRWASVVVCLLAPMMVALLAILQSEGHGALVATGTLGMVGAPLFARMLLPGLLAREDRRLESVRTRMPIHVPGLVTSPLTEGFDRPHDERATQPARSAHAHERCTIDGTAAADRVAAG